VRVGRAASHQQNGHVDRLSEDPTNTNREQGERTMRHLGRTLISALAVPACLVITAPTLAAVSASSAPTMASTAGRSSIGIGPFQPGVLGLVLFDGALSSIDMVVV
jgi:hypothetical protein